MRLDKALGLLVTLGAREADRLQTSANGGSRARREEALRKAEELRDAREAAIAFLEVMRDRDWPDSRRT